jgi:ABC-2 type transport system permease protein
MVGASLYIAVCSARNRIRMRLRRLREPRYLVGAILGAAYLFFVFVLPRRAAGRRGRRGFGDGSAFGEAGLAFGSTGLLLLAAASWILPASSNLLTFTEAETELLFPAPVSRRALIVHRLIRSQMGLLFAAMMPAFLIAGSASFFERLLRGIALWVTFATVRIYFAGITMARAHLNAPESRVRALAWAPLVVTLAATAVVGIPLGRALRDLPSRSFPVALARVNEVTTTGLAGIVLWPTRTLIAPLFVDGGMAYLSSIAGSFVILLAAVAWVLQSDHVFQAAGAELAVGRAPAKTRRRAAAPRVRAARWSLAPTGRPELIFFWKNGMQTLRELNFKSMLPIAILAVYAVVGARFGMSTNVAAALCLASLMLAGGATLLGPGSVMTDLRGDLGHIELLKTWPVKGGAVIRGEMLWPGLLLTGCAWVLLLCAAILSAAAFPRLTLDWRLALMAVAMTLAPAMIFAHYLIHQAAAVMFPAWVPSDNDMRGFESMAQRLILFAGVIVGLLVVMGPGLIAGGIVSFVFYRLLDTPFVLIPGAIICLGIVAIEVILATEALAPAYEQIDLSGVERRE